MLCCPRCSLLSTILNNVVAPDSGSTILFNIVDKCEQRGQQIAKTLFNPVEQRALRFLPCRLFYLYHNCDITSVTVFILSHPVNFFCGRKPEHPEKTYDFQQSVDRLFSHESVLSHESAYIHGKKRSGCCNTDENRVEQCFAAHIVHSCQQYSTIMLHSIQAQQ
jgi:hypothetical protein